MDHERPEFRNLQDLRDVYVADAEERELSELAQVNVPERGEDAPDNPHRRTQRTYEKDLGPLGTARFIRGEYPGENNPDAGKWYETWTLPGELNTGELGIGVDSLTKVRTGTVHESSSKGGAEAAWGDGEFSAFTGERPDLDTLEPVSQKTDQATGKTTEVFDLGDGRTFFRERAEGQPDHVYARIIPSAAPSIEISVPQHGLAPGESERGLIRVRMVVSRIEVNLDPDAAPPVGRVKFSVQSAETE